MSGVAAETYAQPLDPFAAAVMSWYSESVRTELGYAPGRGWVQSLLAYALHTIRTSNIDRRLMLELFSRIARAGKQLARGRDASAHVFDVIASVETAEQRGGMTREQAAAILEWLYYARDVAALYSMISPNGRNPARA